MNHNRESVVILRGYLPFCKINSELLKNQSLLHKYNYISHWRQIMYKGFYFANDIQ